MKFLASSVLVLFLGGSHAFQASLTSRSVRASCSTTSSTALCMSGSEEAMSRKDVLSAFTAAAGFALGVAPVLAEEATSAPEPPPTDWGLTRQYYPDASKMVRHMRYCTNMEKGTPDMAEYANNCKREMMDFVANYRRSTNINGKLSYSNLYTSISVLAGHYASYGPKFPVPEKRRKRLMQEYSDIERAIKRQR